MEGESQKVLQREGEDKTNCSSASLDPRAALLCTLKDGSEEIHRYGVISELHTPDKMRKWSRLILIAAGVDFCRSHPLVRHSTADVYKEFESLR